MPSARTDYQPSEVYAAKSHEKRQCFKNAFANGSHLSSAFIAIGNTDSEIIFGLLNH